MTFKSLERQSSAFKTYTESRYKKRGNASSKKSRNFSIVVIKTKKKKKTKKFWFLTNEFELSAKEIADYYRKRWDIEVFQIPKQELNLSHLVSLNKNGIEVMVYMTMIAFNALLIYKKNDLGYKTAKRRIAMESRYDYRNTYHFAGGNPEKFKT